MSRPRILIVEDNKDSAFYIALLLKDVHGIDVETASSIADGRRLIDDHPRFSHCIIDDELPDGSGLVLVEEIKAESPATRAVVYTGYGDAEAEQAAREAGADAFLVKPADSKAIMRALDLDGKAEG